jgi:23S rRNA pseudouridine2605 synthase
VRVNGRLQQDPEYRVVLARDRLEVDGQHARARRHVYLMLNKRRGLVTTARDEKGRATVFRCLEGLSLPHVSPVGRLDQASEGLLLFTNDTAWAARLSEPANQVIKTYHVQVDCLADDKLLRQLEQGHAADGEWLRVGRARVLRQGAKNSWFELTLDEGKNRHLRRLLAAYDVAVLRLLRVAIGSLTLGTLGKGMTRPLTPEEVQMLAGADRRRGPKEVG